MAKNKLKVKLTVPFAGSVGGVDSPPAGTIVEMDADVARAMVKENSAELAEEDDKKKDEPKEKIEAASAAAPEAAIRPSARARRER